MKPFRVFSRLLNGTLKSFKELPKFPEEPLGHSVADLGGFYAAALKSTLNSRYTLIGKLGWGIHSSVWLAEDKSRRQEEHQRNYVAIKILSTHATQVQGKLANEVDILRRINSHNSEGLSGAKHITTLLDDFTITDHHGPHLCLVFEALGAFRGPVYKSGQRLPVPFVRQVARQMLLALDFMHRDCGIIHTDLKPDNILVTLPNPAEAIERHIARSEASDASPPIVLSHPLIPFGPGEPHDPRDLMNCELKLTDFGTAALSDGFHADLIQPYALRAPEVILGNGWDSSADVWNLGCLIFEFLTGSWLFSPRSGPTWSAESWHLGHMPAIAGEEFDLEYVRQGKNFDQYFTPEGNLRIPIGGVKNLEQLMDVYQVLDDVEKLVLVDFLRAMLRLKPSDRASAAELLQHKWLM